jgi:hypothetical protein
MNQDTDKNRWSVIAAIAVVAVTATALYVTLPVPSPVELSGQVRCTSGARVVGVWIEAPKGDAGWAETTTASTGQSQTAYRHRLRYGAHSYSLHVGCGGNAQDWAVGTKSPYVHYKNHDFQCNDRPELPNFKSCA